MTLQNLKIEQLENKIARFRMAGGVVAPPTGWVNAIRTALGMTTQQLANRLSIVKSSLHALEKREAEGGITLRSLREAADALDMKLVYGLVPKDGSLENLIERKAEELATAIVMRTSQNMGLEDQQNSKARIKKAIAERAEQLKYEMPKALWD